MYYVCLLYALEGIQGLNEGAPDLYENLSTTLNMNEEMTFLMTLELFYLHLL